MTYWCVLMMKYISNKGRVLSWAYHPCRWRRGCAGEYEGCCCEEPPCLCLPVGRKAAVCLAGLKAAVWPPEKTPHEPWWSVAGTVPGHGGAALPCHPHPADCPARRLLASTQIMRGKEKGYDHTPHTQHKPLLPGIWHMVSHIQYLINMIANKHLLFLGKLKFP